MLHNYQSSKDVELKKKITRNSEKKYEYKSKSPYLAFLRPRNGYKTKRNQKHARTRLNIKYSMLTKGLGRILRAALKQHKEKESLTHDILFYPKRYKDQNNLLQYASTVLHKHNAAIRPLLNPKSDLLFDHFPSHFLTTELRDKLSKYKHLTSLSTLRKGDCIMNFYDFLITISAKHREKEIEECPAEEPMPIWFFHLTSFFSEVPENHHNHPDRCRFQYRFPLKVKYKAD
jgi:hypothetical protein